MTLKKKGKSKAKATSDDGEDKNEKESASKFSAELSAELACGVSGHNICWVHDDGRHIQLEPKDLSRWALWIVGYRYFSTIVLTNTVSELLELGKGVHR